MRSNQENRGGALLILAALLFAGFLWWFSSQKNKSAASKAERSNEIAHAAEMLRKSHNRFATAHGAEWVGEMLDSPTNATRFWKRLSVDVQQILMPGKPVAFNVRFADVVLDNGELVLTGKVLFLAKDVDVALVMDGPHWLDLIRTNRFAPLRVAAEIKSVTPRRVVEVHEGESSEVVVLRAFGRAIALDVSSD